MPLSRGKVSLEASPRAVREARRWAAAACLELGRVDLVDTAEMGVSELVTNALLHGKPPIAVRMRGTHRHPRIEVLDGSKRPPEPNPTMADDDDLFATFGRGLGMVAACSHAWGADLLEEGKVVWFEPAVGPVDEPDLEGKVFDPPEPVQIPASRSGEKAGKVRFLAFPLHVFVEWRQHVRELRREIRLLSLAHEGEYPVASTITRLFQRFEEQMRTAHGIATLEHALRSGAETEDIELALGENAGELLAQISEVLDLADAFCRDERLLVLAASEQQVAFQRWFIGEVVRQSNGAEPLPWPASPALRQRAR